jgi:hypothetical protein
MTLHSKGPRKKPHDWNSKSKSKVKTQMSKVKDSAPTNDFAKQARINDLALQRPRPKSPFAGAGKDSFRPCFHFCLLTFAF